MKPRLGDSEEAGRLTLGGLGRATTGPARNALQGGGATYFANRRLPSSISPLGGAVAPAPRPPGGGGSGGGSRPLYTAER